jgi:hypothetical protein
MSTYRFCFRGPRTDELEDFVAGGATFLAAGANLEFDVVLSDDTRADDLKEVLEQAGFAFVAVNPPTPPGFATENQIAQLNVAADNILARLDEIIWHMEQLTELQAPMMGGDGTLLGRLDVVLQLLMFATEAGSTTRNVVGSAC